jgi:MFS family permease
MTPTAPRRGLLPLVCSAQFVLQLDFSIVNLALATIQHDLHFAPADLQWVVTAYAMTYGSLLLLSGRAGDLVGRRELLQIGLVVFGIASLTCGLAQSSLMLVLSRAAQGVGGALVAPALVSLLTTSTAEGPARNRALSLWQASAAAGASAGVVLGGVLTQYVDWRAVFLINVPIVVILCAAVPRVIAVERPQRRGRLDLAGALCITAAIALLILGLSDGAQHGFLSTGAVVEFALSLALLAAFVWIERHVAEPLFPFSIVASAQRRSANIVFALMWTAIASYVYFVSLYMQKVLGVGPALTGVSFLPSTVTIVLLSSLVAKRAIGRFGWRLTLIAALVSVALAQAWLTRISAGGSYLVNVLPALLLTATGMGFGLPAASIGATGGVRHDEQGIAAGLLATSQQIGSAIGLSALGAVAAARTAATHDGSLTSGYALAYLVDACVLCLAIVIVVRLAVTHRR